MDALILMTPHLIPMDNDDICARLTVEEYCFPVPMDIDDDIAPVTTEVSRSFPVPMEIEYCGFENLFDKMWML